MALALLATDPPTRIEKTMAPVGLSLVRKVRESCVLAGGVASVPPVVGKFGFDVEPVT